MRDAAELQKPNVFTMWKPVPAALEEEEEDPFDDMFDDGFDAPESSADDEDSIEERLRLEENKRLRLAKAIRRG